MTPVFPIGSGRPRSTTVLLLVVASAGLAAAGAIGSQFRVDDDVVASGGGATSSPTHTLRGTAGQAVLGDASSPDHAVVSGRGMDDTSVATDVPAVPRETRLEQNRPNPFNPMTTIEFALPAEVRVELVLFDARGRRVSKLLDEVRPVGVHQVVFDASDFSSGIYWYRLQAGSFTATRRMVLVK